MTAIPAGLGFILSIFWGKKLRIVGFFLWPEERSLCLLQVRFDYFIRGIPVIILCCFLIANGFNFLLTGDPSLDLFGKSSVGAFECWFDLPGLNFCHFFHGIKAPWRSWSHFAFPQMLELLPPCDGGEKAGKAARILGFFFVIVLMFQSLVVESAKGMPEFPDLGGKGN